MFCLSKSPSHVLTLVLQLLVGSFERFRLIEDSSLLFEVRHYVCILSPVHKRVSEFLAECSFMDVYFTIRKAYRLVSSKIYLGQFLHQGWDTRTRRCALRHCNLQTGIWTPVLVIRDIRYCFVGPVNYFGSIMSPYDKMGASPQHLIEEIISRRGQYLVVCSTNCYRTVESFLRLCYLFNDVLVLRGTHLAHPRLLHRFPYVVHAYEAQRHTNFQASWRQFNNLIDSLDASMDDHEAEYCSLYIKWRKAKAQGCHCEHKFKALLDDRVKCLQQLHHTERDLELLDPRLLLNGVGEQETL